MEASNGLLARLDELTRRMNVQDRARGEIRRDINQIEVRNGETKKDIENIRDDIAEMKRSFGDEMKWVRRGMWVAAGTFVTFILMLAAVLTAVLA